MCIEFFLCLEIIFDLPSIEKKVRHLNIFFSSSHLFSHYRTDTHKQDKQNLHNIKQTHSPRSKEGSHHGRWSAVLSSMEQSPEYAHLGVRHTAGEWYTGRLYVGGRGKIAEGTQSRSVGMQSLLCGKCCGFYPLPNRAKSVWLMYCYSFFSPLRTASLQTILSQQYDKHPIFILKDVKFQELRAMMDYMYRGEVNISQDQLAALLKAAESLQIKGLSDNRSSSSSGTAAAGGGVHQKQSDAPAAKTLQPPVPASKVSVFGRRTRCGLPKSVEILIHVRLCLVFLVPCRHQVWRSRTNGPSSPSCSSPMCPVREKVQLVPRRESVKKFADEA